MNTVWTPLPVKSSTVIVTVLPPPLPVAQDRLPAPSVDNTCPLEPPVILTWALLPNVNIPLAYVAVDMPPNDPALLYCN